MRRRGGCEHPTVVLFRDDGGEGTDGLWAHYLCSARFDVRAPSSVSCHGKPLFGSLRCTGSFRYSLALHARQL